MSHDDCVVFVAMVESWKRKVGGGYIVVFFFFLVVGGCKLRSGGRVRLLGPGLCFFFSLMSWFVVMVGGATMEVVEVTIAVV